MDGPATQALVGVNVSASTRHANDWSGIVLVQYPSKDAYDQQQEGGSLERVLRDCERSHVHGLRRPAPPATGPAPTPDWIERRG